MAEPVGKSLAQHGTQIFIYNNIRTNQILYSLTRSLNNHSSLEQLPFLGKKTVPARIRKDLWHPLCLVEFPRPSQGLIAYRRLREFRRLHETAYPLSLITQTEGRRKGHLHSTKKRGKILMDQKANSVADLAAVLLRAEERLPKIGAEEKKNHQKTRLEKTLKKSDPEKQIDLEKELEKIENEKKDAKIVAKEKKAEWIRMMQKKGRKSLMRKDPQEIERGGVEGVKIRWANLLDAEFAKQWPEAVVHEGLTRHRYTAAFPLKKEDGDASQTVDAKEDGDASQTVDAKADMPVSLPPSGGKTVAEMRA
ncbi:MAG: hypothetical protein Q9224_001410 [Gallowayella concinna]